jgi:hypothetical protein
MYAIAMVANEVTSCFAKKKVSNFGAHVKNLSACGASNNNSVKFMFLDTKFSEIHV